MRYFLDTAEQSLKRKASGNPKVEVIARFITNQIPFQVEDFTGQVLTNSQNNRVIRMTLELTSMNLPSGAGPEVFTITIGCKRRSREEQSIKGRSKEVVYESKKVGGKKNQSVCDAVRPGHSRFEHPGFLEHCAVDFNDGKD